MAKNEQFERNPMYISLSLSLVQEVINMPMQQLLNNSLLMAKQKSLSDFFSIYYNSERWITWSVASMKTIAKV